jgi:hypothetical protein
MSNVTRDGITKDLEWMKRVGIGGFMLADVNAGGGQTVEPKASPLRRLDPINVPGVRPASA